MTKSAKIHVNKCQNAKKRNLLFADVSISSFLKVVSFADFCSFSVPQASPEVFFVPPRFYEYTDSQRFVFCRFYLLYRKVESAWESRGFIEEQKGIMFVDMSWLKLLLSHNQTSNIFFVKYN